MPAAQTQVSTKFWFVRQRATAVEAVYTADIETAANGLQIWQYGLTSAKDLNSDYVLGKIYHGNEIAGLIRWGDNGDKRDSINGWQVAFCALSESIMIDKIEFTLFHKGGELKAQFAWAELWDGCNEPYFYVGEREGHCSTAASNQRKAACGFWKLLVSNSLFLGFPPCRYQQRRLGLATAGRLGASPGMAHAGCILSSDVTTKP